MALTLQTPTGPLTSLDDWATTTAPKQWRDGRAARELARAWWKPGVGPEVPAELAALLPPFVGLEEVRVEGGARLRIVGRDAAGPMAVHVCAVADDTFGEKVEALLVDSARRLARDEPSDAVAWVADLATAILPTRVVDTPRLGELRVDLLRGVATALAFAEEIGSARAAFVVHELVHLQKTKESARRRNREDLDLFVRRLTAGESQRLYRGQLLGPLSVPGHPGVELFLGKIRRDLDAVTG
jgi:hypothetical protein